MIFDSLLGNFSNDLAIDLGTANTLVYVKGQGVISNEPTVVAVKRNGHRSRKLVAFGNEAKVMQGRTPQGVEALRPMKEGVISDYEVAGQMLRHFIERVHKRRSLIRPRVIVCVPHGITEVEKRAVKEAAESAGAREVLLVEEPMAAAIGAGLPIREAVGSMVVDIGGGTTEVAVISMNGIVFSKSIRVGGDKMDEAIVNHIRRSHNLIIGEQTAEQVKMKIGSALGTGEDKTIHIRGRDLVAGVPKTVEITESEVREALSEPIKQIVATVKLALEHTPPELAGDIIDRGIMLSGGGALLKNMDALLQYETGLPIIMDPEPLTAVVKGSGKILDELEIYKDVTIQ